MVTARRSLAEDRYFDPDPVQRRVALELYESVADLPLICPHSHVDPRLLADEDACFGNPTEMLVIPDHYVFRMLYSRGVPLESLGIRRRDGRQLEQDPRRAWQVFADHFYLFRGTPTGIWLTEILYGVFGIDQKLTGATAQAIYDVLESKLGEPEYRPRTLFERFNVEVLCTTDAASDSLEHHQLLLKSGWRGDVRPTFRLDGITNLLNPSWQENVAALSEHSGVTVGSYPTFVQAIEERRRFFKRLGATATDHSVTMACCRPLEARELEAIFQRALRGQARPEDAQCFEGHMVLESARMSLEDGLVMQLHVGSVRNHNLPLFERFGPDMGADIPAAGEFTEGLQPLLNRYGNDPRLTLIVFTLDEGTYSRELAPLAGHYPVLKLGPPWWFHDSMNGIRRYFDRVMETAGLYNTVGFNDDTRSFPSIRARHNLWRRAATNWIAGLVVRGIVDLEDAQEMAVDVAYRLAKQSYRFGE
ncbi:MAG: glucuronate isomerase [Anaerolineae bacterium]